MATLMYCKKCGRIVQNSSDTPIYHCDYCKSITYEVPKKFVCKGLPVLKKGVKKQFVEEYIKSSPEFDPYLFEHRDNDLISRELEYRESIKNMEQGKSLQPRCPSCGSTSISRIGTLGRMFSVGMFGLASSKIGKTHKCNNCGTTW